MILKRKMGLFLFLFLSEVAELFITRVTEGDLWSLFEDSNWYLSP